MGEDLCGSTRFVSDVEASEMFGRIAQSFAAAVRDGGYGVAKKLARGIGCCGHGAIPSSTENGEKKFERRDTEYAERRKKSRAIDDLKRGNAGEARVLPLGVDADVIHDHSLGEDGGVIRGAGPIAADGEVEDEEERMIKRPCSASGPLGLRERGVETRVDVEAYRAGLPLGSVKMKGIGEILSGGKAERCGGVAGVGDGAGTVERTVDGAGFPADIFHDVDFAALGPTDGRDVVTKHPEGRPHSLPGRNFDAGFEAAVGLAETALGFE